MGPVEGEVGADVVGEEGAFGVAEGAHGGIGGDEVACWCQVVSEVGVVVVVVVESEVGG